MNVQDPIIQEFLNDKNSIKSKFLSLILENKLTHTKVERLLGLGNEQVALIKRNQGHTTYTDDFYIKAIITIKDYLKGK